MVVKTLAFDDFIQPLNLGGMHGRMLYIPAAASHKNSEIMLVYGQHSSLERWAGLVEVLSRYGSVTMPDLPGFGGMASLYSVGGKPTIDGLADYLATFVRWRYKHNKLVIVGLGFGFVIATRMLQNYPELGSKVKLVVSIIGFSHYTDLKLEKRRHLLNYWATKLLSYQPWPFALHYLTLNRSVLKRIYEKNYSTSGKFPAIDSPTDFKPMLKSEVKLWRRNDLRTWLLTTSQYLKLDNCDKPVNLPLWHIGLKNDRYFNQHRAEQHLRVIYSDFHSANARVNMHAPSVFTDAKAASPIIPAQLRRVLRSL